MTALYACIASLFTLFALDSSGSGTGHPLQVIAAVGMWCVVAWSLFSKRRA